MENSQDAKPELLRNYQWDAYTWLIHMSRREMRPVSHLPRVSVKCTSMILDTVNFSIDYSSPFVPNVFKSAYDSTVSERSQGVNSPSQRTVSSHSGDQVLKPICRSDKHGAQERFKRSNVQITMQYLGTGFSVTNEIINPRDEVGMFQQICGGENICVYKGYLSPGETFQFLSKRHLGFPFSASIYINGLIAARISSCCEYRYNVGFQQGRRGCFRVTQLSGGKPCTRCVDFQNLKPFHIPEKISLNGIDCTALSNGKENDFRVDALKLSALELGHLGPNHPGKKKEDLAIKGQNTGKPVLMPEPPGALPPSQHNLCAIRVSTANQRRRRQKKKRVPKEESDSELENIHRDGDWRSRKSTAHRPETHQRKSSKTRSQSGLRQTKSGRTKGVYEPLPVKPTFEGGQAAGPLDCLEEIQCDGHPARARSHQSKIPPEDPKDDAGRCFQEQKCVGQENIETATAGKPKTQCEHHHHQSMMNQASQEDRSIQKKLEAVLAGEIIPCSDVELSDSSESSENRSSAGLKIQGRHDLNSDGGQVELPTSGLQEVEKNQEDKETIDESEAEETSVNIPEGEEERDALISQVTALVSVLQECDEVNELILRNTGMTDTLLQLLVAAIINTKSQVETINLNLNELGPDGAKTIIKLLERKPSVKSLLLHGNRFGDYGINAFMNGITMLYNWGKGSVATATRPFELSELDIGGNRLGAEGLRSVASFLRLNPPLKYLGLAKIDVQSLEAWTEFFSSMRGNSNISHVLLDENNLGDDGASLLARALQWNQSLVQLDLDDNEIGDGGGQAIAESLSFNERSLVKSISLEDNPISKETMERIQTLLTRSRSR